MSQILQVAVIGCILSLCGWTLANTVTLTAEDETYIIELHNQARNSEPAETMPPLTWNNQLAEEAQKWTDLCNFQHQIGKSWGENLGITTYTGEMAPLLKKVVDMWMGEEQYVSYTPEKTVDCCSMTDQSCCHYTQVIWAKSTTVGCAVTRCPTLTAGPNSLDNMLYMACYYDPRGNSPRVIYDWRPYLPKD